MTSEVIVDVQPKEISIALLEDKKLVEFQKEGRSATFSVGNVYLAKVKKLMPGLNAMSAMPFSIIWILVHNTSRTPNTLNRSSATRKSCFPYQKQPFNQNLKRKEAYKMSSRPDKKYWYRLSRSPFLPKDHD